MRRHASAATAVFVISTLALASGCGESRYDKLKREQEYANAGKPKGNPLDEVEKIPPHPTRDAMEPLLRALYTGERLPDVVEADIAPPSEDRPYEITAGVLAVIRIPQGMTEKDKALAIIKATAEADGWVHRAKARKNYADHIHKVMRSFGEDQKQAVLDAYGQLKLLDFFNSEEAATAIADLSGPPAEAAKELQARYTSDKEKVWQTWMDVKMYARREVAGDEPFRGVLKAIRAELGQAEPEPVTWDAAHGPEFKAWAKQVNGDPKLFEIMTNLRDLRDQEDFRSDTHAIWAMEGSELVPDKAKKAKVDPDLGFAVHREDLGGGYQEMTFVFPKKLAGDKLKRAYLRSHIYRQIFSDFQTLSTSGGDFKEGIVPDKYDPAYAKCGSAAALDAYLASYKDDYAVNSGLKPEIADEPKIMERAVKCIVAECSPEIRNPDPDDETDSEGPAPGTRLAFFQMLARFQKIEVDTEAMRKEEEKSQAVLDAEALLKANPNDPI